VILTITCTALITTCLIGRLIRGVNRNATDASWAAARELSYLNKHKKVSTACLGTSTICWPCSPLFLSRAITKPVPRRSKPNPGRVIMADTTAAGELLLPSSLAAGSGMTLSRPRNTEKEESTTPPTPEMTFVAPVANSPTCCSTRPRRRAEADDALGEEGIFAEDSGSGDRSCVLPEHRHSTNKVRPTPCIPHNPISIP
jgi:hypothetical protein